MHGHYEFIAERHTPAKKVAVTFVQKIEYAHNVADWVLGL
tara:strand:- start:41687 stop:41806 length:120 start_codon:yes stop_codon:yes gene_type:complete